MAPKRRWGGWEGCFVNGKERKGVEVRETSKVRIKRLGGGMWGEGHTGRRLGNVGV